MKAAVVVFPGTNCEKETYRALACCGFEPSYIWHDAKNLDNFDCVFLCGGFSYGDYIRSGALAKFSPVIGALNDYIKKGRGVSVGICNGFQILCETNYLSGALLVNEKAKFICKNVSLELNFNGIKKTISLPLAHKEGRYYNSNVPCEKVFLKYLQNPNGSMFDAAGLYNENTRVMGLMPHPERAVFAKNFGFFGIDIFEIIKSEIKRG